MENYEKNIGLYTKVASLAEERYRSILAREAIPSIITSRAKHPTSLLEKLKKHNQENVYKDESEISQSIIDLSGVRIALYFPRQAIRVAQIFEEKFDLIKRVPIPHQPNSSAPAHTTITVEATEYKNQFMGYHAIHLHVHLRCGEPSTQENRETSAQSLKVNTIIENQIASLLMHAWSKVNHDLVYKTYNRRLSNDELRALNTINSLMLTGEVVLNQLKTTVERRVAAQKEPLSGIFELGIFIQQFTPYKAIVNSIKYRMGSLSWLLLVTKQLGINNPQALGNNLESWKKSLLDDYPEMPIVWSIIDYLVSMVHNQKYSNLYVNPYFLDSYNTYFNDMKKWAKNS